MSKIVRVTGYVLQAAEEGDKVKALRLKKWSAAKLFHLIGEFKSIVEEVISGDQGDSDTKVVMRAVEALLKFEDKAIGIIEMSLDETNKMTTDVLKELLYPEDFVGVLAKIVEMNFTEELIKNFQKLLGSLGVPESIKKRLGA